MVPAFAQMLAAPGTGDVAGPAIIVADPIMDWVWYAQPYVFFARRTEFVS